MAIYHLSVKLVKRSAGRSAIAAAAYRSAEQLHQWSAVQAAAYRSGETLDDDAGTQVANYSRRQGVVDATILASNSAPNWVYDRQTLWNQVEVHEKRKDAQLAREIVVALPHEFSAEQRKMLVHEFVRTEFVQKGMVADVAIHKPDREGDQRNHHAHILLTTRRLTNDGFAQKAREWNARSLVPRWRERWGECVNQHLADAKQPARIDHRSYERQGLDIKPTYHLGPSATALKRAGLRSPRVDRNRAIARENADNILGRLTAKSDIFVGQTLNRELKRYGLPVDETRDRWIKEGRLALVRDEKGTFEGFTTAAIVNQERRITERVDDMARAPQHKAVPGNVLLHTANTHAWHAKEKKAVSDVMGQGGFKFIRDSDEHTLDAIRQGGEAAGYRVVVLAPDRQMVDALKNTGFKDARTVSSFLWRKERLDLHPKAKQAVAYEAKTIVVVPSVERLGRKTLDDLTRHGDRMGVKMVFAESSDRETNRWRYRQRLLDRIEAAAQSRRVGLSSPGRGRGGFTPISQGHDDGIDI